jgi:endonuclease IV
MIEQHKKIVEILQEENNNIWIRPETTGKRSQWGTLDEIIAVSKEFSCVLPCIDFAHIHAREDGKFNTYDEFCYILDTITMIAYIFISDKAQNYYKKCLNLIFLLIFQEVYVKIRI